MENQIDNDVVIPRLPVDTETHKFHDWTIIYKKSHILKSMCINENRCKLGEPGCCELCEYGLTLELPHLPDMVFWKNTLIITHKDGGCIEFNPLDALKQVQNGKSNIQVACSDEWKESRPDAGGLQEVKPFDWTFTTDYQGTWNEKIRVEETEQKLDIFKLMKKERIIFYHDLTLFEDELHDHGISVCSVKIRVMPSGFFVLLNYYLRVDGVHIQMNGTRYHYELGNNYILREYTSREAKFANLKHVPPSIYTNPSEIEKHLTVTVKTTQKLFFTD